MNSTARRQRQKPSLRLWLLAVACVALLGLHSAWAAVPAGFHIPESTLSPDGRLGVIVPDFKNYKQDGDPQNKLVKAESGDVFATIEAPTFFEDPEINMNDVNLAACWSHDGATLAWVLGGKWFPTACVLVNVADGEVEWQTDVLTAVQKKMLAKARAAAPENYAAAKKQNTGNGSAYPDGFSINIETPKAGFTLPWKGQATLDSNVKDLTDNWPSAANLYATMNFVIKEDGTVAVYDFELDATQTGVARGTYEAPDGEPSAAPTGELGRIFRFPTEDSQVFCEIPEDWEPKQTGDKVEAISPDGLVLLTLEGMDPETVEAACKAARDLLDGDGLGLGKPVTAEEFVSVNDIETVTITTKGADDNGPCTVTQQVFMVSDNVSLVVTFVVSQRGRKANAETITNIRRHVTRADPARSGTLLANPDPPFRLAASHQ